MTKTRGILALILLALAASSCGRYLHAAAAVVDGKSISIATLDTAVNAQLPKEQKADAGAVLDAERKVLAQMIQDQIISHEAKAEHIVVSQKDVDSRLQQIQSQFQTQQQYEQALRQQGIDPTTIKDRIRLRLQVEQIQSRIAEKLTVTAADIKTAYGDGSQFKEVHARHILFSVQAASGAPAALKKAQAAENQLRAGADFAALAKKLSEDPGSKGKGGDLGFIKAGQTVPEFERAAFSMKSGQISRPIQSQFGYHIIQVLGIKVQTLAQVTKQLTTQLQQQKAQQTFQTFLSSRVKQADVQVNPRFGVFDAATLQIVPKQFFKPASPTPQPESIPGLNAPIPQNA